MTIQLSAKALREKLPQSLHQVLSSGSFVEFELVSEMASCLRPLLEALDWRGDSREFAEALPHHVDDLTLIGLCNAMAHLGYTSHPVRSNLAQLDPRHTPCLFVPESGSPLVVVRIEDRHGLVFDSGARKTHHIERGSQPGIAYVFRREAEAASGAAAQSRRGSWIRHLLARFGGQWKALIGVSFAANLLALAVPLFTLALYDSIIPSGSLSTLAMLAIGMAALLAFEVAFLHLRGEILTFVGARIDFLISSSVFKRLLDLPPAQTEQAQLGAQVSRLRDLHAVRSIFTGPVCVTLLDLPFVVLFLFVTMLVGGWLVLIPLTAGGVFALAAVVLHSRFKGQLRAAAQANADHQSFLVETATKARAIKLSGLNDVWVSRHRHLSARAVADGYALIRLANSTEVFAEALKLAAGVTTLLFGILAVIDNHLTVGALIASMALVWRTLSPFQVLFLAAIKLEQARTSIQSINALMALEPERHVGVASRARKNFAGRITLAHVSYRFRPDRDPAVFGLNLEVKPGELIAVTGPSGAGKSTTLKLILGMYPPQLGSIQIDGLNVRQLNPVQLRQSIGYLSHSAHFFHGTVAQNIRLALPTASDSRIAEAALEAGVFDEVMALPQGFDTWLDSDALRNMPEGLRQRIALARVFVRESPILLLDEPGNALDREGDEALVEAIRRRKGQCTILMVTHRPSHIRLADRVLLFERGVIRASGSPEKILPMLKERGR
jgi:ATP-binding cassette subfamily C protein/ATP-binding cassette subfamily C protein LapB